MRLYRDLFRIAIPIAVQQFVFTGVSFVDTLMIGTLGETAIAAVGLSNQLFFLYNLVAFGLASGGAIFFAQYWGRGDTDAIARSTALTTLFALAFSIPFLILGHFFPSFTLRLFSPDPMVIETGIPYLKTVAFSYPFFAMTFVLATVLRSVERASIPMMTGFVEAGANIFLNYILIFGKLGAPALGVYGAGVATLLSRAIGFATLSTVVVIGKLPGRFGLRHFFSLSWRFIAHFLKYTLPTVGNETAWATGMMMYSVIYAHMSTRAAAAQNILSNVEGLSMGLIFALSTAAGIMVGKELGVSQFENAYEHSKAILKLILMVAVVSGVAEMGIAYGMIGIFNVSAGVRKMVLLATIVSAFSMPVKSLNIANVVGFLRAGGDTRFSFITEASVLWLVGVPLCALGGLVLGFSFPVVYLLTQSEEVVKAFIFTLRFKSKKWMRNVVEKTYEFDVPHA